MNAVVQSRHRDVFETALNIDVKWVPPVWEVLAGMHDGEAIVWQTRSDFVKKLKSLSMIKPKVAAYLDRPSEQKQQQLYEMAGPSTPQKQSGMQELPGPPKPAPSPNNPLFEHVKVREDHAIAAPCRDRRLLHD